jgi:phospholipid-binding lipoprotein MlaA
MLKPCFLILITLVSLIVLVVPTLGQSTATYAPENLFGAQRVEHASIQVASLKEASPEENESEPADSSEETVPDPFEPLNRAFFEFNDRLYFWVLKPIATGYKTVVPEEARVCVRNFFNNLAFPVRFVNNVFQGKFFGALEETCGFLVNSTVGLGGLADVAKAVDIKRHDEDLGQTLAVYGSGPAFYIHWPFFGPSTLRDTIGGVGDAFLDPLSYIGEYWYSPGTRVFNVVNETSLRIGDYESLKKAALDPYVALRDAYYQNRLSKIRE